MRKSSHFSRISVVALVESLTGMIGSDAVYVVDSLLEKLDTHTVSLCFTSLTGKRTVLYLHLSP